MTTPSISIPDFAKDNGIEAAAFESCIVQTKDTKENIINLFDIPPCSPDADMVVYGSIARKECVTGSDVDWTLLVDGQANPEHLKMASDIRKKLSRAKLKDPGNSGLFGQISFSHELIHNIGGQSDTNHNLTKRILLLLESACISFNQSGSGTGSAYDRIITGIIFQYVEHDSGLNSDRECIPRFLLNDVVRFWRTMCVDFAYKQKDQEGDKWALRNIKLRISRKMLYVKGLLMCFSHYGSRQDKASLCSSLKQMVDLSPFELLISMQEKFKLDKAVIAGLIKSYNAFLEKLNDPNIRKELEGLNMEIVYENSSFINLRNTADEVQEGLDKLFINSGGELSMLTLKYCIF